MGNCTNRTNRLKVITITLDETRDALISLIREGVNELHNGHHYLSELEMFFESEYEDNEWLVTQIKVKENGDIIYVHSVSDDDCDWHSIEELEFNDLIYVAALYT